MMFETLLTRSLFAPPLIQTGNDKPRKPHWVGDQGQNRAEPDRVSQGKPEGPGRPRRDPRGYRDLATVTLGEVQDALNHFGNQLVPSPYDSWVAPNYFCRFDLVRRRDGRPPVVFGRVGACYPGDGHVQNIEDIELHLPQQHGAPETILLHGDEIRSAPEGAVQSYCVRVRFLLSEDEIAEFSGHDGLFLQNGFCPEKSSAYLDVLEMNEHENAACPWLYVIGSRWFASIPDSVQSEVGEKLRQLLQWNKLVFNYHPGRLEGRIRSLNRELGFKPGFTDVFLIEPEDPKQTAAIISATFDRIFRRPEGYAPKGSK